MKGDILGNKEPWFDVLEIVFDVKIVREEKVELTRELVIEEIKKLGTLQELKVYSRNQRQEIKI